MTGFIAPRWQPHLPLFLLIGAPVLRLIRKLVVAVSGPAKH